MGGSSLITRIVAHVHVSRYCAERDGMCCSSWRVTIPQPWFSLEVEYAFRDSERTKFWRFIVQELLHVERNIWIWFENFPESRPFWEVLFTLGCSATQRLSVPLRQTGKANCPTWPAFKGTWFCLSFKMSSAAKRIVMRHYNAKEHVFVTSITHGRMTKSNRL